MIDAVFGYLFLHREEAGVGESSDSHYSDPTIFRHLINNCRMKE